VAAQKRAEEQVTEPWMRVDDAPATSLDDNPLFPMPGAEAAVPQRIDVVAEKSRPREDSAQRVPRLDLGPARESEYSGVAPIVSEGSSRRPWAAVAVILSLLALAAVVAFYLVRG